jgi:hypothetical protein
MPTFGTCVPKQKLIETQKYAISKQTLQAQHVGDFGELGQKR